MMKKVSKKAKRPKEEDFYVAVPVDNEGFMHPAVDWHVSLGHDAIERPGKFTRDPDNYRLTLSIHDDDVALRVAIMILEKLHEQRGEVIELELTGHVSSENFHFEDLTEEETKVVYQRWLDRIEKERHP